MNYTDIPQNYRCSACGNKAARVIRSYADGSATIAEELEHLTPAREVCSGRIFIPAQPNTDIRAKSTDQKSPSSDDFSHYSALDYSL